MNLDYSKINKITINKPLKLDCGITLDKFDIAYETYGKLDESKTNAILVFHALSGDQFVTGINKVTGREGWWNYVVGPNLPIDTEKYFIICANVIGGCMGSSGPKEINPSTNKPYGLDFPGDYNKRYGKCSGTSFGFFRSKENSICSRRFNGGHAGTTILFFISRSNFLSCSYSLCG